MLEFLKWREVKQDASPGSLIYAGPQRDFSPSLCRCSYDRSHIEEVCMDTSVQPQTDGERTHFVRMIGIHDADAIRRVGEWLNIHPLILEDIMSSGHRPKLAVDDSSLFMVLKDVQFEVGQAHVEHRQVGLYWHGNIVFTFQEHEEGPWDGVLDRIRSGLGRIRSSGPSYLAVALVDALIDNYYTVLSQLNDRAEELEASLAERQTEETLMELYTLKRESVLLRSIFVPVRDMLQELERQDVFDIPEKTMPYLTDVRDHAQQVVDTVTALHEILSGMLEVQISLAGMHMNNVMKVLTTIATIFIPLTFLAGVYGMNFEYMPELHWRHGYPLIITIMTGIAGLMVWYFKRKDWF